MATPAGHAVARHPTRRPHHARGATAARIAVNARCWATRTAPPLIPSTAPVSSAVMPRTIRNVRISRARSVTDASSSSDSVLISRHH